MSEETTLADLLQLNLHKYEDEVRNIVDKAVKESGMEKVGAKAVACSSLQRILGLSDKRGDCEGPTSDLRPQPLALGGLDAFPPELETEKSSSTCRAQCLIAPFLAFLAVLSEAHNSTLEETPGTSLTWG